MIEQNVPQIEAQVEALPMAGNVEVIKAKRKVAQPKVEDPALRAWAKATAENLKGAGFSKKNVQVVTGKREKLVSGDQTLTWFTKPEYAQAVMAYL